MPKRTVTIAGRKTRGLPGIHRFIRGNPPRIECLIRARRCQRCGICNNIWMTDDWRWRLLSQRWWRKILCVSCYRDLVPPH
jgi:hypothetical protein